MHKRLIKLQTASFLSPQSNPYDFFKSSQRPPTPETRRPKALRLKREKPKAPTFKFKALSLNPKSPGPEALFKL